MVAGIDSMVLIYAGLAPGAKVQSKDATELRIQSQLLLHKLRNHTIVLPTICVSEVLRPVAEKERGELASRLSSLFLCQPFDLVAANIAAELWQQHGAFPKNDRYGDRTVLKADVMIVASAKAAGATNFYTNDRKCKKLASTIMKAFDLPKDDPEDMFARTDIERGEL